MTLADAGSHCTTFWCDYVSTQFDPAHLLSELGFTIIFELLQVIVIVVLWRKAIKPLIERRINKVHAELDAEHHVVHHDHTEGEKPKQPEFHYDSDMVMRFQPFPPERKS